MAKTGTGKFEPVVQQLRDRIGGGDLGPGDWLPSESQLMEAYGVSRYSAREAIKRLAGEGMVVVVDGKGSYVRTRAHRARHDDARTLTTTTDGLHDVEYAAWRAVEKPTTYRTNTGVDVALTMGIAEHTPLFVRDCLLGQHADGPAGQTRRLLHRTYLPMATRSRVPALADDPFVNPDGLYAALRSAGIDFTITEHVRAAVPAPDDTTSLRLPAGAAVMLTRRVLRDTDGRALAMEETRRSAEDAQLTYAITPTPPPPAAGRVTASSRL